MREIEEVRPPTPRWTPMRHHDEQRAWRTSGARFNVVPAGRRSGKTEIGKRKLITRALSATDYPNPNFFAAAPTRDQAKRIFWDDLKALSPKPLIRSISETELRITYINGASVWVIGMDKPQRIEGMPWDGGVLDEYANMKPSAWTENVRPALSDRMGWCDLIGVPEGRNHYYEAYEQARADDSGEWAAFTWPSSDILPPEEIEAAKRDLDELTYQQEYEASFVNFVGRAYYPFGDGHIQQQEYNARAPLIFCFDFNVEPGVSAICQERDGHTAAIGEVHIPRNSNTPAVCRKLVADWGEHAGDVVGYGDATGGARGTARVQGSDWDLVKQILGSHYGKRFYLRVPKGNPAERARVNAVNARLRNAEGDIRLLVDPKCTHLIRDLEGVRLLEGGSGELDKKNDPKLTHISDALGYYIAYEFPIVEREAEVASFKWM